jgi:nucleotidyltransferase substrate binding protein (TIGR01987 family)
MTLDFTSLANAITRLEEGLDRYRQDIADMQIRDGLIQRFEFTYDLVHKMVRRVLEQMAADTEAIDHMSFPSLIRTANESGLVAGDWPTWQRYRGMRNITSHTYDEAKALEVVAEIPAFLDEAKDVLRRLRAQTG